MIRSHPTAGSAHRLQVGKWKWLNRIRIIVLSGVAFATVACQSVPAGREEAAIPGPLARAFMAEQRVDLLNFRLERSIHLRSMIYHPQGMTKVGSYFFVSAVEVVEQPRQFQSTDGGRMPDRTPGSGRGHLFKFDEQGNLIDQTILGEGSIYHPGGIDYDGKHLWVAVAEYRPYGRSIVYQVDPDDLEYREVFRVADHIGALIYNHRDGFIHGVSWGSREFYTWTASGSLVQRSENGAHYVDYQDCQFVLPEYMLCSGMAMYSLPSLGSFALGGVELVRITDYAPVHQMPVVIYADEGNAKVVMTRNPMFAEMRSGVLTFYFLPEGTNAPQGATDEVGSAFGEAARTPNASTIYVVATKSPAAVED